MMQFLCAMDIIRLHHGQTFQEWKNLEVFKYIVTITVSPKHTKVRATSLAQNLGASIALISYKFLILDKNVLIIGAGPSGVDITYAVSKHARRLAFSHRTHNPNHRLPNTVSFKVQIREITELGAVFMDGTQETFTHIIYCTGEHFYMKCDHVGCFQ